jgi:hypothetical protein
MIDTKTLAEKMIVNKVKSGETKLAIRDLSYVATEGPIANGDHVFDTHDLSWGIVSDLRDGYCTVSEPSEDPKQGDFAEIGINVERLVKLKLFVEPVTRPIDLDQQ